jgi:hypothetical protein
VSKYEWRIWWRGFWSGVAVSMVLLTLGFVLGILVAAGIL